MADTDLEDEVALAPAAGPLLERAQVPWLAPVRERLAALQDQGRLPHGLLLAGAAGAGQAEIGTWLAARLFCRSLRGTACRECADCRLFSAGNHPDFRWVGVLPDKKEISIDQMRALAQVFGMRSYRGGAKVAVITPAESMSTKAFNALLKTLEEPPEETYLVLAASRIDRVPKTVMSRCMRFRLPLPAVREALDWLGRSGPRDTWPALLEIAGGAPFLAAQHAEAGVESLDTDMREAIAAAIEGRLDFVAFAKASAGDSPAARLAWLESWLTRSLKDAALARELVNNNRLPWLRPPGADLKIRAGYGLLDRLRDARRQLGGSLNAQLLFEGLVVSLAAWVHPPERKSGESSV
jgi:DNA polymerase III subunit delta'